MKLALKTNSRRRLRLAGFSIEELVISMGLALGSITAIMGGYRVALYKVEWTSRSMAAQSLAAQRMEQVRAARWEPQAGTPIDELQSATFPLLVSKLDVPVVGTNAATATVTTTIQNVVSDPPSRWIQVECVWTCGGHGPFTNRLAALRTPDL